MLYEEVDYMREGKNAERFSENFKGTDWIKAPGINWSRSTSKVYSYHAARGQVAHNKKNFFVLSFGLACMPNQSPIATPKEGISTAFQQHDRFWLAGCYRPKLKRNIKITGNLARARDCKR